MGSFILSQEGQIDQTRCLLSIIKIPEFTNTKSIYDFLTIDVQLHFKFGFVALLTPKKRPYRAKIRFLASRLLISHVDQIKYDLEELSVHGELVNRLHMSKVPYRKRREEGITGPLKVVLCQY